MGKFAVWEIGVDNSIEGDGSRFLHWHLPYKLYDVISQKIVLFMQVAITVSDKLKSEITFNI
jgi:hypothetical protein